MKTNYKGDVTFHNPRKWDIIDPLSGRLVGTEDARTVKFNIPTGEGENNETYRFELEPGQHCAVPGKWAYAVKHLAPQLKQGKPEGSEPATLAPAFAVGMDELHQQLADAQAQIAKLRAENEAKATAFEEREADLVAREAAVANKERARKVRTARDAPPAEAPASDEGDEGARA